MVAPATLYGCPSSATAWEMEMQSKTMGCAIFQRKLNADQVLSLQSDKLQTLIKAAKVEDVEPIWTTIFAKVCE